jgi:hypothetical protein
MDQKVIDCLSKSSEQRALDLLQNGQVELSWDRTVIRMRTTDLIVLNKALRDWMDDPDRDWTQTYSLWLNDEVLFLRWNDLYKFCAMVHEAIEQLPRRFVRWVDLDVRIVPCSPGHHNSNGRFSPN